MNNFTESNENLRPEKGERLPIEVCELKKRIRDLKDEISDLERELEDEYDRGYEDGKDEGRSEILDERNNDIYRLGVNPNHYLGHANVQEWEAYVKALIEEGNKEWATNIQVTI